MRAWAWWAALALAAARARELDPAACSERFDVQRDKIIRTEESREMGARYLAELDVGSRAECLRLCCETDACDVFVFEEKSPGSCYLFACGPPEDFRCKFTAHGNFSSGVLALSRRLAELQDRQRLEHHERDLARLRNVATSSSPPATTSSATRPTRPASSQSESAQSKFAQSESAQSESAQLQSALSESLQSGQRQQSLQLPAVPSPPPLEPQPPPPRRCSRYQFECRRGGECIAVYNACDGVPQCADGSDEAPELGCPAPPSEVAAMPHARPPQPPPPELPAPHPSSKTRAQVVQVTPGARRAEFEVAEGGETGELWPRRLAQAQHRYSDVSGRGEEGGGVGAGGAGAGSAPRIFSHQGGLLQPAAFAPAWPHRAWPPDPPPDPPHNEVESVEGVGAASGPGAAAVGWGWARPEAWPDERRAWPVPARLDPELAVYVPAKTMPELPLYSGLQRQAALRDAPKKGLEVLVAPPSTAPTPPSPAAPRGPADRSESRRDDNNKNKKASKETAVVAGVTAVGAEGVVSPAVVSVHAAHAAWPDERDGLSERPPAAVLLLVLGTLMTASLGGLLACRARAARRRRRAHPRLALDADYLVNGMYL